MVKKYFQLDKPYAFDWNDVVGPLNLINTLLVIRFGLVASWFGVFINLNCMVEDVYRIRRLNLTLLHFSILVLNIYFLLLYYNII